MQVNKDCLVHIQYVSALLGPDVCSVLPQFHALTGCDITSFKYLKGKVASLKRLISNKLELCTMIKNFGSNSSPCQDVLKNAVEFVKVFIYNGNFNESYLSFRIKL